VTNLVALDAPLELFVVAPYVLHPIDWNAQCTLVDRPKLVALPGMAEFGGFVDFGGLGGWVPSGYFE
jgi:hypothetical protein